MSSGGGERSATQAEIDAEIRAAALCPKCASPTCPASAVGITPEQRQRLLKLTHQPATIVQVYVKVLLAGGVVLERYAGTLEFEGTAKLHTRGGMSTKLDDGSISFELPLKLVVEA